MNYGGLSDYLKPKEQAADTRSDEAKRRATEISAWGIAAQRMASEVSEEAWQEHRRVQDSVVGVDRGLTTRHMRLPGDEAIIVGKVVSVLRKVE